MPTHHSFNYNAIKNTQTRKAAREAAKAIKSQLHKATSALIEVGKQLQAIRDRLTDEEWKTWLEAEFQWSQTQASNFMRSADRFGELTCLDQFQPTALFVPCRKNVPDEAIDDAVSQAQSGQVVSHKAAKEILARHNVQPARNDAGRSRTEPAQDEERATPAKDARTAKSVDAAGIVDSAEDVFNSIDQFCARVDEFAVQLDRDQRETLADRFLQLALQLRTANRDTTPAAKPKRTRRGKSATTKAA